LHGYGAIDSGFLCLGFEFGEELVRCEGRALGNPRVFFLGVIPEMVVGVDHGGKDVG
jgi:hypothetical protein